MLSDWLAATITWFMKILRALCHDNHPKETKGLKLARIRHIKLRHEA